jgi:hypothetical protein
MAKAYSMDLRERAVNAVVQGVVRATRRLGASVLEPAR